MPAKKPSKGSTSSKKAAPAAQGESDPSQGVRIYELKVSLIDNYTLKTVKRSRGLSRTIAIRGNQSLQNLHDAIFAAFDRFDPHMWEFQIGGTRPFDKEYRIMSPSLLGKTGPTTGLITLQTRRRLIRRLTASSFRKNSSSSTGSISATTGGM